MNKVHYSDIVFVLWDCTWLVHSQNSTCSYQAGGGYTGTLARGTLSDVLQTIWGHACNTQPQRILSLLIPCLSPLTIQRNHRLDDQKKLRSSDSLSNSTATPERPAETRAEKTGQILIRGVFLDQKVIWNSPRDSNTQFHLPPRPRLQIFSGSHGKEDTIQGRLFSTGSCPSPKMKKSHCDQTTRSSLYYKWTLN